MSERTEHVKELQKAAGAIRTYVQAHRAAVALGESVDAALSADARLNQWEREEQAIKDRLEEHQSALLKLQEAASEQRSILRNVQVQVDAANDRLATAEREAHERLRALDAGVQAEREAHETTMAELRAERERLQAELENLRADAQRIREHFTNVPA
jgi:chromosome segregation ATPase